MLFVMNSCHTSPVLFHLVPVERAARGKLQAAQRPHHFGGVEPRGLERVRRLGSG